jgi:hypothetical protein
VSIASPSAAMLVIPVKAIGTGLPEIFGAQITVPGISDPGPDAIGFIVGNAWFWSYFGLNFSYFLPFLPFEKQRLTLEPLYLELCNFLFDILEFHS